MTPRVSSFRLTPRGVMAAAVVLLALTRFLYLGSTELQDWDEAMYAWRAKVCVIEGAWLDQHHHSVGEYDKPHGGFFSGAFPPLYVWATAALYEVFGFGETASRFWAAAAGAGCVVLIYLIGRLMAGDLAGFLAAFFLASVSYFCKYSRYGQFDVPYIFFVLLTVYWALLAQRRGRIAWWAAAGVALGLGLMTKIALAMMAPVALGMFGLWRLATRRTSWRRVLLEQVVICGVGLVVMAPWHVAMLVKNGEAFWRWTVSYHLLGKAQEAQDLNQGEVTLYFIELIERSPSFIWGLAAWGVAVGLWIALRPARKRCPLCRMIGGRSTAEGGCATRDEPDASMKANVTQASAFSLSDAYVLASLWLVFLLAVFSMSATKRSTYLLPMFPPFCLLAALPLAERIGDFRRGAARPIQAALILGAALIVANFEDRLADALRLVASAEAAEARLGALMILKTIAYCLPIAVALPLLMLAARFARRAPPWVARGVGVVVICALLGVGFSEGLRPCLKPPSVRENLGWRELAPRLNRGDYRLVIGLGGFATNRSIYYLNGANRGWAAGTRFLDLPFPGGAKKAVARVAEVLEKHAPDEPDAGATLLIARTTFDREATDRLKRAMSESLGFEPVAEGRRLVLFEKAK